jgi:hypothetical protein
VQLRIGRARLTAPDAPQAEALYRSGRAQRLMQLLSERRGLWYARPNLHLAFRSAAAYGSIRIVAWRPANT